MGKRPTHGIEQEGPFTHGRVNKRKSDVLERKRNNLTQLQTAHQRVDLRRQTLQTQRAQARGLAAASLVSAAAGTAFPANRPATRVAQALVNAYQKNEMKQDNSGQPLAIRAGYVLDSALESMVVGSVMRTAVNEMQEAIPAAQRLPRILLNDVVGAAGALASSLLARWF